MGKMLVNNVLIGRFGTEFPTPEVMSEKFKWGLAHAVDGFCVRSDSKWMVFPIYNTYINLSDKDYIIWKLKYA